MKLIIYCFFLVFFLFCLSGCGLNLNWDVNYIPENLGKNPLATVRPKVFLLQFEDNRSDTEKDFVGYYIELNGKNYYTSKLPPREIVLNSLEKILNDNGHKSIYNGKNQSFDLIFYVKINKFLQDYRPATTKGDKPNELVGHINADIKLIGPLNNQIFFSKTVNTITIDPLESAFAKSYEVPYSKTIKQFLEDIILDFELIEVLKKI